MTRKPIVVGFDGSSGSRCALEWALDEARFRGDSVHILYAVLPPTATVPPLYGYGGPIEDVLLKEAEDMLASALEFAKQNAPEVKVTAQSMTDSPAGALLKKADEASMLVVGSRGLGALSELLVGSTGFQIAAHATCPAVVVRPSDGEFGPEVGRVVAGIDGSELSNDVLRVAYEEASVRGVGLTALCAWDMPYLDVMGGRVYPMPPDVSETESDEVTAMLAEVTAGWPEKYPDVDLRRQVVTGKAVNSLVDASRGAELLVVGSRGLGGFRSLLLGSVSHSLLHHAHSTMMVVHHSSE